MLIVEDNLFYVKKLSNYLLSAEGEIKLVKIATDGSEAIKILDTSQIDLVLLDLDIPKYNGLEIIKYLNKQNKTDIIVIVISEATELIKLVRKADIVKAVCHKTIGLNKIKEKIEKEIYRKRSTIDERKMRKKVINILVKLGFNLKHKGTQYLIEAILYAFSHQKENNIDNIETDIYKVIAYRNEKKLSTIKSDIVKSINYAYNEIEYSIIKEYFAFNYEKKPTAKVIIMTVLEKIR